MPNAGKSTIFNAITNAGAATAAYPFCTIDPNIGVVNVPDERMDVLARLTSPPKIVYATMEFVDIAGLVKGASQGEGLGNQFLGHIRQVDAIAHVVRCFREENVTHTCGAIDPVRDIEIINLELILADLQTLETRHQKIVRLARSGDKLSQEMDALYTQVEQGLQQGKKVINQSLSPQNLEALADLNLLTSRPTLYVANTGETDTECPELVEPVRKIAEAEGAEVVTISGKVEAELMELSPEDRAVFMQELGIKSTGLARLIWAGFKLLKLITFFTVGGKEQRAWPIPRGITIQQAAGKIHSDMQRGFIAADVIHYSDFVKAGSELNARQQGFLHLEGKNYIMEDGDIINVRFNV